MAAVEDEDMTLSEMMVVLFYLIIDMPLVLCWTLITSRSHRINKHKTWKRVLVDQVFSFLTKHLDVKQQRWLLGDTMDIYIAYMKHQKLPLAIDELGEGGRLLWLEERRRTDRVILYFHGGAYLAPLFCPPFWKHVLAELKFKRAETGFVALQYSIAPFPTHLKQAVLAVKSLLTSGVQPQNIQFASDSAGANLVLALFSHILHPVPDVPRIAIAAPFSGVYIMSPWVSLSGQMGSMITNDNGDAISARALIRWRNVVPGSVSEQHRPYLEVLSHAPVDWFIKLSTVVECVLITAGGAECMRDDIIAFANQLKKQHAGVKFVLHKHGVHTDPYFDFFLWPQKCKGELTPLIVEFFASNFDRQIVCADGPGYN